MKHTLLLLQRLIVFGVLLTSFGVQAQTSSISLTTQLVMSPNPSPYLSDWQSRRETAMFTATLSQPMNQPVKLITNVSLNGQIVARTTSEKMPILTLHQGQNILFADRIIPFDAVNISGNIGGVSQRLGRIPEGNYDICVWFISAETGLPIGSSSCGTFSIRDMQPPSLISPLNDAHFISPRKSAQANNTFSDTKQRSLTELAAMNARSLANAGKINLVSGNTHYLFIPHLMEEEGIYYRFEMKEVMVSSKINTVSEASSIAPHFQWLPPMPAPSTHVQYKLQIVEVLPGQTPEAAFGTNIPLNTQRIVTTTNSLIGESETWWFNFSGKKQFAWGVQSIDMKGNPIGKNNGWSETRIFDVIGDGSKPTPGDPDFDLLRIRGESFFDVFDKVDSPKAEPCGFQTKKFKRKFYTPCKDGMRSKYEVWSIFTCALLKGHSGPHHGTAEDRYVLIGSVGCTADDDNTGTTPTEPAPPKEKIIKRSDLDKIPTSEEAAKIGVGVKVGVGAEPCPYIEKTLLRTVVGSWKKVSTVVRNIAYKKTVVAWADVKWQRTIWNVFAIKHCTLEKNHAGAHKLDAPKEVFEKYGTITETISYGPGVAQTEPKPHWSDSVPTEDPK